MKKKELNKLRLEILSDKSITGISFDPRAFDLRFKEPEIILFREAKQIYIPDNFKNWDKLK